MKRIALIFLMVCLCEGAQSAVAPQPPTDWPHTLRYVPTLSPSSVTELVRLYNAPLTCLGVSFGMARAGIIEYHFPFLLTESDLKRGAVIKALTEYARYALFQGGTLRMSSTRESEKLSYATVQPLHAALAKAGGFMSVVMDGISFLAGDGDVTMLDNLPYNEDLCQFMSEHTHLSDLEITRGGLKAAYVLTVLESLTDLRTLTLDESIVLGPRISLHTCGLFGCIVGLCFRPRTVSITARDGEKVYTRRSSFSGVEWEAL